MSCICIMERLPFREHTAVMAKKATCSDEDGPHLYFKLSVILTQHLMGYALAPHSEERSLGAHAASDVMRII